MRIAQLRQAVRRHRFPFCIKNKPARNSVGLFPELVYINQAATCMNLSAHQLQTVANS
jgi:hypothetical protein